MKKILSILIVVTMLLSVVGNVTFANTSEIKVIVDGKTVTFPDSKPYINEDGRTVVPLRFVSETLGSYVEWLPATQSVLINMSDKKVKLKVGERRAHILKDGLTGGVVFDTKAAIKDSRTFVPLRFVSEMLGAKVEWDGKTRTVKITTGVQDNAKYDPFGRKIRTTNLPKNSKDYPYILNEIPNTMYEFKYPYTPKSYRVSSQLYNEHDAFKVKNIDVWMKNARNHYDLVLNVDYKTINNQWVEDVWDTLSKGVNEEYTKRKLREYVQWVKDNKIVIKGWAEPEPSMFYNSQSNFVRTQFEFTITSFKENKNLIYDSMDQYQNLKKNVTYSGFADVRIISNVFGDWGDSLKISSLTSLFENSLINEER